MASSLSTYLQPSIGMTGSSMHSVPKADADTNRERAARRRKSTPASGDSQAAGGPARGADAEGGMPEGARWPVRCLRPAPASSEDCMASAKSDHGPATVGAQWSSKVPLVSQPREAMTSWARVHALHRRRRSSMAKRGEVSAVSQSGGSMANNSPAATRRESGAVKGRGMAGVASPGRGPHGAAAAL